MLIKDMTPEQEKQMRILLGDPVEMAYQRIEAYAASLCGTPDEYSDGNVTADELIETAKTHIDPDVRWGDYITKGGLLEGTSTSATFWADLAIYLQIDIPQEKRGNFFSCSC